MWCRVSREHAPFLLPRLNLSRRLCLLPSSPFRVPGSRFPVPGSGPSRIHHRPSPSPSTFFCSEPLSQVTEAAFQEAETDMSGFGKLLLVAHLNAEEEEQDAPGCSLLPFLLSTNNNKAVPPVVTNEHDATVIEKEEKEIDPPPDNDEPTKGSTRAAKDADAPPTINEEDAAAVAVVQVQPAAAPPPCATTAQTHLSFIKKRKKSSSEDDSCAEVEDSSCSKKKNRQSSPTTPSSALTASGGRTIAAASLEPTSTSMATPRGVEAALVIDTIAQRVADRCVRIVGSSRALRSPLSSADIFILYLLSLFCCTSIDDIR